MSSNIFLCQTNNHKTKDNNLLIRFMSMINWFSSENSNFWKSIQGNSQRKLYISKELSSWINRFTKKEKSKKPSWSSELNPNISVLLWKFSDRKFCVNVAGFTPPSWISNRRWSRLLPPHLSTWRTCPHRYRCAGEQRVRSDCMWGDF